MRRILIYGIGLFLVMRALPLYSQEKKPEPEPSPAAVSSEEKKDVGEILFFPGAESRPSNDRYSVTSGQTVEVCVRLTDQAPEFIQKLKKYAVGFRLIMEDNQEPPLILTVAWGDWLKWLRPDEQGCMRGSFQIPPTTKSSVYQVSDLLLATNDHNYYSLREYLYDFGQVDEFEVKNPADDLQAPALVGITTFSNPQNILKMSSGVLRAKIQQLFKFKDQGSGINKKSLRVFYQLDVDGEKQGIKEARCKKWQQEKYTCTLVLREPYFEWSLREVVLSLSSIHLKDRAGNLTVLSDAKLFAEKGGAAAVRFEFSRMAHFNFFGPKLLKEDRLF